MEKILPALLLLQLPLLVIAQPSGIRFETGKSWAQITQQAKAENKYIFVDAFTTWCGPCKTMSKNVFPLPEVGAFYNAHFINVKAQLDTTEQDNEQVKQFYKDAHKLLTGYNIKAFPTFLFFAPNGELIHRASGSSTADRFILEGKDAMNPETQYYAMKKRYHAGKKDSAFLRKLVLAAEDAYETDFFEQATKEYLNTQPDIFTRLNLELLSRVIHTSGDPGFSVFYKHGNKVDSVLGAGRSAEVVKDILLRELVYPTIYPNQKITDSVDWQALEDKLKSKFPELAKGLTAETKTKHFLRQGNWTAFRTAANDYVDIMGEKISPFDLNNFAWTVFQYCEDKPCLESALAWSKLSLTGKEENNTMLMDTYANLLYKLGRKEEAIAFEEKALAIAGGASTEFKETLAKMKKGEKTWK